MPNQFPKILLGLGRERDYIIENLSMLAASGMTISDSLKSILINIKTVRVQGIVRQIINDMDEGAPLWRALERSVFFPPHVISLVQIGEKSGKLSDNLGVINLNQQKERVFRSRIRSAMMYPVFVLGLTCVISIGIAWFILPKLSTVFNHLNVELPLITKVFIAMGNLMASYGAMAVPVTLLLAGVVMFFLFFHKKTRWVGQKMLFAIPGIKNLIMETELSRFGYLLGTLLEANIPITNALTSLSEISNIIVYKRFYEYLSISISDGNSFHKSFSLYKGVDKIIPPPVQQLIVSGEQSGNLAKALLSINKNYEDRSETTAKDLSVVLEPVLLVIVWLGVVTLALAVILPIYRLVGSL